MNIFPLCVTSKWFPLAHPLVDHRP
ncbi:tryptophanase leader peptide [Escherichia coli]